jgi:hypothetical protein
MATEQQASDGQQGVVFPADADGSRSTSAVGRAVVADALRPTDPTGARAAEHETNWRSGYLEHFRRLVEAGLESPEAACSIATGGLDSLHERMRVVGPDGQESTLEKWSSDAEPLEGVEVVGNGEPVDELVLPYHGERLRDGGIRRRLESWARAGTIEPTVAEAVGLVLDNPDWLRLDGHTVAVLGAGAEMGPLPSLMRWGARVAAVDLDRPEIWKRLLPMAKEGAGSLVVPVRAGTEGALDESAGVDLLRDVPAVEQWLREQPGTLVVGNYVYADGATNTRVSVAVDELSIRLQSDRDDVALAFLATPTDVFAVPGEAVDHSTRAYEGRSGRAKTLGRPLRALSGGRLLRRQYVPGSDPGINDSMVPQQGPNYALAKRLQRWRATVARRDGALVSMNVAPPTRTRSVVKNRALAAAYAGAHRFGVEVFEPATSNVLMAALLVHDLHTGGGPTHEHTWQDEAYAAAHVGLWRTPYAPRSALGLAALLGYGATRG